MKFNNYQMPMKGGCMECGGICGGSKNPKQLLEKVLQHVEDGEFNGRDFARVLNEYNKKSMNGAGFFGDFWDGLKSGFKSVAKIASPILGLIPNPISQVASKALGIVGGRKRKQRILKRY